MREGASAYSGLHPKPPRSSEEHLELPERMGNAKQKGHSQSVKNHDVELSAEQRSQVDALVMAKLQDEEMLQQLMSQRNLADFDKAFARALSDVNLSVVLKDLVHAGRALPYSIDVRLNPCYQQLLRACILAFTTIEEPESSAMRAAVDFPSPVHRYCALNRLLSTEQR